MAGEKEVKEKESSLEDTYSVKSIPLDLRKPWTYHAAFWAGVCFVLAAMMTGGTPLTFLPVNLAIASIVIGNFVLLVVFLLTSYLGAKTGLSTYLLAERAFGTIGARILINLVISGIPAFAWYGVETWLAAASIGVLTNWDIGGPGRLMDLPTATFLMISGVIMAIPPILGITSIAIMDYIMVPIMAAFTLYGVYLAFTVIPSGFIWEYVPQSFKPETALTNFMLTTNLVIGAIMCGATIAADSARWIKPSKKGVVIASVLGFFLTAVFMEVVGMFYGLAAIKAGLSPDLAWNIVLVLKALGVSTGPLWPLLIFTWLLQFSTNIANAYSGGLAIVNVIKKPSWRRWVILAGAVISSLVAVFGIVWYWVPYLTALANWIAPAAGIIITEFYLVKKGRVSLEEVTPKVRVEAIVGWFVGGLIAYYFTIYMPYLIPSIAGLITAMIIHLLGSLLRRSR
ncbi:MAG: cytosine permease [Sulfolobales archaeon]